MNRYSSVAPIVPPPIQCFKRDLKAQSSTRHNNNINYNKKRLSIFLSYFDLSFVSYYEIAMFPISPFLCPWNILSLSYSSTVVNICFFSTYAHTHTHTDTQIQLSLNPQMYSDFNDLHRFVMAEARFCTRLHALAFKIIHQIRMGRNFSLVSSCFAILPKKKLFRSR